jgi:predicted MFS family arabinose efflux permease
VIEWRSPAPLISLSLFRNPVFSGVNVMTLLQYFALSSVFFFLSLNFQQAQGNSPFEAGLHQMPLPICLFLTARIAGRLTDRIGPLPVLTAGVLLGMTGLAVLTVPGVGADYWTTFFPALVLLGVGNGMTFVPLTSLALGALPSRYSGIASGLNNAVSRVAQMLAVAIFGMMMLSVFRSSLAAGTASLPLGAAARTELMEATRSLGATQPPAGLTGEVAQAVSAAIRVAFVDGFRLIVATSVVLAGLGLTILHLSARGRSIAASADPVPASAD